MDRTLKRIFRWIFPVARVEVTVFISITAVFIFLSIFGIGTVLESLREDWIKGEYLFVVFQAVLLILGAFLLAIPFIEIVRWEQFDLDAARLSVLASTFVIACCYGWLMSIYLRSYMENQKWMGLNYYLLLAVISTLSFIFLVGALFYILDMSAKELPEFNLGGGISIPLLLVNLFLTTALIAGNYFLKWLNTPDIALILFNTFFLASKLIGNQPAHTVSAKENKV